jgi:hypothetical protein
MSSAKEKLVTNVKEWLVIEKEIKILQTQMKELKKRKTGLSGVLVEIMKNNEIDCFDITGGKIMYTQNRVKGTLNKKHLMTCLDKYFEDNPDINTDNISKFILDNREVKTTEIIRHKPVKN